jgi:hypothetical protein
MMENEKKNSRDKKKEELLLESTKFLSNLTINH